MTYDYGMAINELTETNIKENNMTSSITLNQLETIIEEINVKLHKPASPWQKRKVGQKGSTANIGNYHFLSGEMINLISKQKELRF